MFLTNGGVFCLFVEVYLRHSATTYPGPQHLRCAIPTIVARDLLLTDYTFPTFTHLNTDALRWLFV